MSGAKDLLAKLRRSREFKCDLGNGLSVTCMRPSESEVARMTKPVAGEADKYTIHVEDEHVRDCVVGWDGFSEAAILGAAVGSSDPIEFDRDLWAELAGDRRMWFYTVAGKMLEAIVAHNEQRAAAAKN